MKELLFLVHRIPYPPNKGDKLRSFNLLKQLSRDYKVHLGTFVDDEDDWRHVDALRSIVDQSCFVRLVPWRAKLRSLSGLLKNQALSLPYYRDATLRLWVSKVLLERPIRHAVIFSGTMAQYVEGEAFGYLRRVVDFVDVDSDKWRQYADAQKWPMNWLYRREARSLLGYERQVAASADASVFVSGKEAELFKSLAPESAARIWGIHNGVDLDYFDPRLEYANPYPQQILPIVFTGAMDYWANIDAVRWFANEVYPVIQQRNPAVRFYIVGARPSPAVQQLARTTGIFVTGTVKDIRPYLAHARVAVAPLRIARGVQNKVLEAMAMAMPVVVSPQALDGIVCDPERELIVAGDATSFCERVGEVISGHHDGIGTAARARIERDYSWESNLKNFERLLEGLPMCKPDSVRDGSTAVLSG